MGTDAGTPTRLELGRGQATAVVNGGAAALVLGAAVPDDLLSVLRSADGPHAGPRLARRLGALLMERDEPLPGFGIVAGTDGGTLLFLAGAVVATAVAADGSVTRVSGADATTWVDRVIGADQWTVTLAPEGEPVPAEPSGFELTEGVVPAGWLRLRDPALDGQVPAGNGASSLEELPPPPAAPGAEATPEPPTPTAASAEATPEPPTPTATSGEAMSEPSAADPERTSDLPPPEAGNAASAPDLPPPPGAAPSTPPAAPARQTMVAPAAPAPDTAGGRHDDTLVEGILCDREHLNRPGADHCLTCGEALVGQRDRVRRPRPALGFLVFDDGATFTLDARYVLGREPESDDLVANGGARPIALEDERASVSRVHAELRLVGWDVQLLDRGSTNGTYVFRDGSWEQLVADEPRLVEPGTRMAVGQRTFVYDVSRPL